MSEPTEPEKIEQTAIYSRWIVGGIENFVLKCTHHLSGRKCLSSEWNPERLADVATMIRIYNENSKTPAAPQNTLAPCPQEWTVVESYQGMGRIVCNGRSLNADPIRLTHCHKLAAAHNASLAPPPSVSDSNAAQTEELGKPEADVSAGDASKQKELALIGDRLRTQDNRCTSNPMFCVQEKVTIYGMDPRWSDDIVWIEINDGVREVEAPRNAKETDTIQKSAKKDYWKTVMAAFTEEGCKEYLKLNGHNHRGETRIYVESWNRCPEMIAVRSALLVTPSVCDRGGEHAVSVSASPDSPAPQQNELTELLDQILRRAGDATTGQYEAVKRLADIDAPALVNFARLAVDYLMTTARTLRVMGDTALAQSMEDFVTGLLSESLNVSGTASGNPKK